MKALSNEGDMQEKHKSTGKKHKKRNPSRPIFVQAQHAQLLFLFVANYDLIGQLYLLFSFNICHYLLCILLFNIIFCFIIPYIYYLPTCILYYFLYL